MKLGRRGRATIIGAVRAMNPTKMIMKQGSAQARAVTSRSGTNNSANKTQGNKK